MRRLQGALPRTYADHRSREALAYRAVLRALVERIGPLPSSARVTLREYGRLCVDMQRLHEEKDRALKRGRVGTARKIDRRLTPMRTQFQMLEVRLEEIAKQGPARDLATVVVQAHKAAR